MSQSTKALVMTLFDGKKLKSIRLSKGLTQKEIAEGICTVSHISQLENGKLQISKHTQGIAEKLGVEAGELLLIDPEETALGEDTALIGSPAHVDEALEHASVDQLFEAMVKKIGVPAIPTRREKPGRPERDALLYLNMLIEKSSDILESYERVGRDPAIVQSMKLGLALSAKSVGFRLAQCDPSVLAQVDRETRLMVLTLKHRDTYDEQEHFNKIYEEDRNMRIRAVNELGRDVHLEMASFLLENFCDFCSGQPICSPAGCPVYRFYEALSIPKRSPEQPSCPYSKVGVAAGYEEVNIQ